MSDTNFDTKSIFESYRKAFEPTIKAQQQGVKALDRVGRYQYDVAGDYLEWGLAQAKAALVAQTPAEFVSKQVELTTALSDKLRARAQEFIALATDAQSTFVETTQEFAHTSQGAANAAARTVKAGAEGYRAAAAEGSRAAAEGSRAAAETLKTAAAQTKKK